MGKKKQEKKKQDRKSDKKREKAEKIMKAVKEENTEKKGKSAKKKTSGKNTETGPRAKSGSKEKIEIKVNNAFTNAQAAVLLRALGDENRLQILDLLKEKELCNVELLQSVNIVQSTLSHHIKILAEAGIVKCRKEGIRTYYSIQTEVWNRIISYIKKWS